MAKTNGNLILVSVQSVTLACQTNADLSAAADMIESTCKGDAPHKTFLQGNQELTVGIEIIYDPAASAGSGIFDLAQLFKDGTVVTWRFGQFATAGEQYFSGSAVLSGFTAGAPINDLATGSASLQVTGEWNIVTVT